MVDMNDRAALWQRLLDMKYFDAHSRKQLKAEQKYFFEGETTYEYNKYLGKRQVLSIIKMHCLCTRFRHRSVGGNGR